MLMLWCCMVSNHVDGFGGGEKEECDRIIGAAKFALFV